MRLELLQKYKIDLIVPVGLIVLSEFLIFQGNMKMAMIIDAFNLTILVLSAIYVTNRLYVALMLLPLFRLLNVAMPVFFKLTLYSYVMMYLPMFIPIYFIMKNGVFSMSEAGFTMKGFGYYLPLALTLGLALGWGEYRILQPGMLIPDLSLASVLVLSLIMILFVGVVEEFIFRSSLQTAMEDRLGSVAGILATSLIFGLMHSGYHLATEIIYVSVAGLIFGLLFWLTKSLPIIAVAHGATNISLFMLTPVFASSMIFVVGLLGFIFLAEKAARQLIPNGVGR